MKDILTKARDKNKSTYKSPGWEDKIELDKRLSYEPPYNISVCYCHIDIPIYTKKLHLIPNNGQPSFI